LSWRFKDSLFFSGSDRALAEDVAALLQQVAEDNSIVI